MVELGSIGKESESDVGDNYPAVGRYHAVINDADDSLATDDKVIVQFAVLSGLPDGQQSRTLTTKFLLTENHMLRLQRLALCVGLLKPNEPPREIDFTQAIGRQLVIEVEDHEYTDKNDNPKTIRQLTWLGMWSLTNPEVADVPKNAVALKLLDNPTAIRPAATSPPAGAAPPAAAPLANDWSDLVG